MEKSKFWFFVAGFGYRWEVGSFSEKLKNKEKYQIIENNFFQLWVWISVGSRSIFWKTLKFPIYPYFCRLDRIILNRLKRNKEKYRKNENKFFQLWVSISVGSRPIFWKALKFPIYPYFCRLDRIILGRLKKIKKNIEKSKIIFVSSGFGYRWEVGPFSERL